STKRASPTTSLPARAVERRRSTYQCECPGSAVTFRTRMLCSAMRALSQANTGYKPRGKSAVAAEIAGRVRECLRSRWQPLTQVDSAKEFGCLSFDEMRRVDAALRIVMDL
ncbi:MAG: hypothetical protein QOF25_3891, partial [Mycobacterium sp.]|nr:hypothetical protein [Mycobacterium sp.]